MFALRCFILSHRRIATAVIALALAMKLLVPAGYMPVVTDGRIAITICQGVEPTPMPMPGMKHGTGESEQHDGPYEAPCAFTALLGSPLAGTDPLLLTAAILYVMASALRIAARPNVAAPLHLRPPLRGPPALA